MKWDLSRLFDRHAPEIDRFLRRRGHTPETAADLTQDAFARLLTAAPEGPLENPRAYLHEVARNLSIDFNRRERRFTRADLTDDEFLAIADPHPLQEQVVFDRQRLVIVERALAELPERTRFAWSSETIISFVEQAEKTRVGFTLGGGAEYAINDKWSLDTSYTYSHFGSTEFDFENARSGADTSSGAFAVVNGRSASNAIDLHTLKVCLNYRF